jgi:hypothetical protein
VVLSIVGDLSDVSSRLLEISDEIKRRRDAYKSVEHVSRVDIVGALTTSIEGFEPLTFKHADALSKAVMDVGRGRLLL